VRVTDPGSVARVARLLGDESRTAMLLALLDGGSRTVSELAAEASVGVAAASEHVSRLAAAGLVTTQTQGRCKYVRLTGADVAQLLETLSRFGEEEVASSLGAVRERERFATARTCYDHLAGRLGVAVFEAMSARRLLRRRGGLAVTAPGRAWLAGLDVDLDLLEQARRPVARECLDVTERRAHLAGSAAAAMCDTFTQRDWVRALPRSRALAVTPLGERALEDLLGIGAADLRAAG
jgi:DNA-binding transcriptional ArsR family regulator